jgi:hypothetical protein
MNDNRVDVSVGFCQWLKDYFSTITERDELTTFEANTIRSELYEKVFPRTPTSVRWQRVNDEPFEYAIQQGLHGDEFVKLPNRECLRRRVVE